MSNEAQDNRTVRARTGRDGRGRDGRTRSRAIGVGTGGDGRDGTGASTGVEPTTTTGAVGAPSIENRGQPRRYQRKSQTSEATSQSTSSARTRTTTETRATAGPEAEAPNSPEQEIPGPAFEVSETRELAASTIAKKAWTNRKKAKEQAEQTALTLLTILDGAIVITLGPACMMTPDEHKMIDEPLARILARMAPETTELIDRWTDPLLLATGLIMWGARVFLVLSREVKREAKKHKAEPIQAEPETTSVGLDLNHPIQATGIPVEVAEALG